jgi:hypothetical protein
MPMFAAMLRLPGARIIPGAMTSLQVKFFS